MKESLDLAVFVVDLFGRRKMNGLTALAPIVEPVDRLAAELLEEIIGGKII